jgi:oligosaccharide repeat unit polymerase
MRGDLLSQSQKRNIIYADDVQGAVYGSAWQSQLASVGLYAGFVLACAMIAGRVRATPRWLALLIALLFFGSIEPLLGQSRSSLIITAFNILVFAHYYARVKPWHAAATVGVAVTFVTLMGALREGNTTGTLARSDFLDHTLGSGNGFDAIRTAAIMEKMPGQADFLHGESLLSLFFVLVPRTLWPDKPRISMGGWVKEELFGVQTQLNGWPPGLVAEGYMNFGHFGMIVLPFFAGLALRTLYETVRPKLGQSFLITILYAAVLYGIGFKLIALNLSLALAATFMTVMPAVVIILFSSGETRNSVRGPNADRRYRRSR